MSDPLKQAGKWLIFVLLLLLFLIGVFRIFTLRFTRGDIYPPHSSFRSDPQGCRALHDALVHTGKVGVQRNVRPLHRLDTTERATVLAAGMEPWALDSLSARNFETLDALVKHGGRLVVCYRSEKTGAADGKDNDSGENPETRKTLEKSDAGVKGKTSEPTSGHKNNGNNKKNAESQSPDLIPDTRVNAARKWGFKVQMNERNERSAQPASVISGRPGLQAQSWRSSLIFTDAAPPWKPVYVLDGKVVLMERNLGKGSLVLASDSYFLSNGALKNEPNPTLLAYVLGRGNPVIFEEFHFGIRSEPGVAGLVKRFGLQNVAWALVLFCLLYVWKNAGYFVPPREEEGAGTVSGRDQASGLASLYKRHIPAGNLLGVCVREWEKTTPSGGGVDETVKQQIRNLAGEKDTSPPDPVAGYRAIKKILSERKTI